MLRSVAVGKHRIDFLIFDQFGHRFGRRMDREHRTAIAIAFTHEFAALTCKVTQCVIIDTTSRPQRRQFAEAMSRDGIGPNAEALEYFEIRQLGDGQRRLRDVGLTKRVRRLVELSRIETRRRANVSSDRTLHSLGLFGECVQSLGEDAGQILPHTNVLTALPREDERQLALRCTGSVVRRRSVPRTRTVGRLQFRLHVG